MTETEKMQQLHLAKAQGHQLSAEDDEKLKDWYEMLDREESVINRNNRKTDISALKRNMKEQVAFDFHENSFTRKLSDLDRDIFLKMLEDPSEPNEVLKKAVAEYKKRIADGTLISKN